MNSVVIQRALVGFRLLLIVNLLGTAAPVLAADSASIIKKCLAFGGISRQSSAEKYFEDAVAYCRRTKPEVGQVTTIVRGAVRELVNHPEWDQATKANFWREVVGLIQKGPSIDFISHEYPGTDGSIVFQGGEPGTSLVLGINGEVYRGTLMSFFIHFQTRKVWKANYSDLVLLKPPESSPERN